ncbi:MAG: transglycosylase domain-containing protein [Bacteroidota bacterium]|nr:transglycosylase domain-containing protein [Bacteroidota bacterium]MDP4216766.1 transglycosylase domain-containing protein [Bacteroidota bacterium]MDP4247167.1 transglycosylase domain-containing protein [Bacteroidota bacterium]MDP4257477.1 transglycosylase domain-containing protein [Bacteroidota bacterium]
MTKPVRILWIAFFSGLTGFIILILLISLGVFGRLPSLTQLENPTILLASEVYADDGTAMGKFYEEKGNRTHIEYKDISPNVINALVSTEDERFYEHSGIDGKAVMRAVLRFGRDGGGSTLTQQLALNMFNGERSHNPFSRVIQKLKEWIISIELERHFTKQEILALYLNQVSFSDNVYGIRNASRTFFQKDPANLSVDEAAVLVGMVNNPTVFNPRSNPKSAVERRNTVISRMVSNHFLTEEEARGLKQKPIDMSHYRKLDENNGLAPYFRDVLRSELKKWCKEHIDPATGEPFNLFEDGLKIYTTINPRMQVYADEAVAEQMPILQQMLDAQPSIRSGEPWKEHANLLEMDMRNTDRWRNEEDMGLSEPAIRNSFYQAVKMKVFAWNAAHEKDTVMTPLDSIKYHRQMLQAGLMVMDPFTGAVKAWVGGIDFKNYKFDHININTKRQVGSTIKPFLYGLAIEDFNFTPQTECDAVQQYFPGYGYVPARANPKMSGTRPMADGLAHSINEVAAYLMKQFGPDGPKRFSDFLRQVGIPTTVPAYPSLALGTCDLSVYEMLWGYTIFPSNGISTQPFYMTRIEDKNGNVLARFIPTHKEVISQATAYIMARMMQGPVDYGTAAGLRQRLGVAEMGGKTGTTNDNSDFWFIGYTPQLLAGVWVGCDDRFVHLEDRRNDGGHVARPIWERFFQKALSDNTLGLDKQATFVKPDSLSRGVIYGYNKEKAAPPGAQGADEGNGDASAYDTVIKSPATLPVHP